MAPNDNIVTYKIVSSYQSTISLLIIQVSRSYVVSQMRNPWVNE
jgi:hypothetical protein